MSALAKVTPDRTDAASARAEAELVRNLPPHSVDAEQAVLGGILLTPEALDDIQSLIAAEDFYAPAHRHIYTACLTLLNQGAPVNLVSVRQYLKDNARLEEAGGSEYLAALATGVISSARIDYYAAIVRDKAQLRALILSGAGSISRCFAPGQEARAALDEAEADLLRISERRAEATYRSGRELAAALMDSLEQGRGRRDHLTGINTGYKNLNTMTGGFQRSDLIILAARPAMGKTALALNIACRAAEGEGRRAGVPVAVFSLEMSTEQLIQRILCGRARVNLAKLRRNQLDDGDWSGLQMAAQAIGDAKIFIDDTPALSILDLRSRARRLKRKEGIELLLVDYLQLMRAGRRMDSRELEIAEISRGLKALAKELNIPVIALAQLNRKLEERGKDDKRPILSDLRESGAIEQDADVIMFIYRESVYQKLDIPPERDSAEIIFGKHRNGQTGTVNLVYLPAYTQFEEFFPGSGPV